MDNQKLKLIISLLFSSFFGFGNALLLTYIHYRAYLMPNKCILVCINKFGEIYLDFITCAISLLVTGAGVIYAIYSLFWMKKTVKRRNQNGQE